MRSLSSSIVALGLLGFSIPALAGDLSAADVRKVMNRHGDEVKVCYLRHGMSQRTATGKLKVSVIVQKSGAARDVTVEAPGVKGKQLGRCVATAAKAWSFPEIDSVTEVELPFLFQHTHARGAGPRSGSRRATR
jgi:hypothetical protein